MSFVNPNGLWFLIGIPVLIILYIIKQKYKDRAISSSFIWRKSEHLIKKSIPWRRLLKYIVFALQLLAVAVISFVVARPVLVTENTNTQYYIIIDGSASMLAESDGESRFDRAVEQIEDIAEEMVYGSKMTVILADNNAICAIRSSDSESAIKKALTNLECGLSDADIVGAISLAESEIEYSENYEIILFTDKEYENTGDVLVLNMSNGEWNTAVTAISAESSKDGITVTSSVVSYGIDSTIALALYVDGVFADAQFIECTAGVLVEVTWDPLDIQSYSQIEVSFDEEDAISLDNSYVLCSEPNSTKDVLIVSASSYFIKNVIDAIGDFNITIAESLDTIPADEDEETADADSLSGYDLYIFDEAMPSSLPDDGAVWLINPDESSDEIGLTLGETAEGDSLSVAVSSSSEVFTAIIQNLSVQDIVVSEYTEPVSYEDYTAVLACGNSPVLLVKEDDTYVKTLVLMFDLHDSNLPLLPDFPLLVYNMVEYSMPSMLEERDYTAGETITINTLANCSSINIEGEDGTEHDALLTSSTSVFTPQSIGVYNVTQIATSGSVSITQDAFFVHIGTNESNIYAQGGSLGLEPSMLESVEDDHKGFLGSLFSGEVKLWPYLAVFLLLILILEWWLYYREEY